MKKTVCELFAGVGGFRVGLERSTQGTGYEPWDTVFANQWEPGKKRQDAFECYKAHFGSQGGICSNADINTVDKKSDIPPHTLLVGGFPCQDYSVAATGAKGIKGQKGVLWWDIYDTLEVQRPPFVLLENVDRLLKSPASQRGRDFSIILASFWKFGYAVEWRVVNAADYGFVQRRRRTFIFAYRLDTNFAKGQNCIPDGEISKLLGEEGFFANSFPIEPPSEIDYKELGTDDLKELTNNFKFEFKTTGFMREGKIWTMKETPSYHGPQTVLRDILDSNVPAKYYLGDNLEKWDYMKGSKHILRTTITGHQYPFAEGPIAFPDSIDKPARTMLTSEASANRSTHVICDPETNELRLLTPEEAEAIQGFPKGWTSKVDMSTRFRYFCMGNALVTGCITIMGVTLNKIMAGEPIKDAYKEAFSLIDKNRPPKKEPAPINNQKEPVKRPRADVSIADTLGIKITLQQFNDVQYRFEHLEEIKDCLTEAQYHEINRSLNILEAQLIEQAPILKSYNMN